MAEVRSFMVAGIARLSVCVWSDESRLVSERCPTKIDSQIEELSRCMKEKGREREREGERDGDI